MAIFDAAKKFPLDVTINQDDVLGHLDDSIRDSIPYVGHQYVTVRFTTADTDLDISHSLKGKDPEAVAYHVVRADRPCNVYQDLSSSRRPWGTGFIILRCSTANATVRILLISEKSAGTSHSEGAGTGGSVGDPGSPYTPTTPVAGSDEDVLYNDNGTMGGRPFMNFGYWSPLTNGDPVTPELIFDGNGDTIAVFTSLV